jgi:UDP-N-acetylglucosamine 2-epimerase (non-hydrolysing)/GDP/UDP-N,N'-diacetylbacillosamine 2-epimerase (hydrolysing)
MHLDTRYGLTYKEITEDGVNIDEKIEMNTATDTSSGICKSMGLEMICLAEAYKRLKPDMIILLGDRYEIFVAASAAVISKIPIAHIHGGEITRGAYDDCLRHAITKMSYLHFTSTEVYRQRVIQMGEEPDRVYNVGSLGIENIKKIKLLTKQELERKLEISLERSFAVVTIHPVTLDNISIREQFQQLEKALNYFQDMGIIFTKSNSDAGGNSLNEMIDAYVIRNKRRAVAYTSLGTLCYLSLVRYSQMVIGNSSSGIMEAPFLNVPTVDIGDRQMGRVKPASVISCENSENAIITAIKRATTYRWNYSNNENPYESKDTSIQIISIVKQECKKGIDLKKSFYNISGSDYV